MDLFQKWLDFHNYPYLNIENFPEAQKFFKGVKSPDFLLVLPNFGIIAVNVLINSNDFLFEEGNLKKYVEFEQFAKLQVWYVFGSFEEDFRVWYWIPLKEILTNPQNYKENSIAIQHQEDISKLISTLIKKF